ncbi:MAG: hypothetical protein MUF83_22895, partial [Acidimicrobiales bacterium]|nr:hypothetical protein [Acidimicrobiales bacterium]
MSLALAYPPLPGIWVRRAQDCLDALSAMTTVDEVVAAYGSARAIVTETLGAPIAGGAGTRRAVRATGVLLTHRLGPALAVEALSWAASAAEAVDPATIEAFLEHAASAVAVHRPLRLEDRHVLVGHLAAHPSEAARRRTLYHLWDAGTAHDLPTPPSPRTADDDAAWLHELFADLDDPDELAEWLWLHRDHRDPTAPTPPPRPRVVDVYDAATPDEQAVAFDRLDLGQRAVVAGSHLLFELAETVVARCLVEHPRHVLTNPACPDGLRT